MATEVASVDYVKLEQNQKSSKRKCIITTAVILILLLIGASIAGYFIYSKYRDNNSSSSSPSSSDIATTTTSKPTVSPTIEPTMLNYMTPSNYSVYIANRMCQFCLISYCVDQGSTDVPTWDCPACIQYFKDLSNVTTEQTNFLNYDVNAFVVYDDQYYKNDIGEKQANIVIAFAGTDPTSITDWIDDIDFIQIEYPLSPLNECTDCYVHKGFYETYAKIKDNIWDIVNNYRNIFGSNIPIQITGHSLGGALAAHCALDGVLTHNIDPQFVYTYGEPRIGNNNFAKYYNSLISINYRITHSHDPVPHLPTESMGTNNNFWHVATEVFYKNDPNGTYIVCDGSGEDENCSDVFLTDIDVSDHLDYMGYDFTANLVQCKI